MEVNIRKKNYNIFDNLGKKIMQATLRTETIFFPRKVGIIEIKWDIGFFNI